MPRRDQHPSEAEIQAIILELVESLPPAIQKSLEGVEFVVEEEPELSSEDEMLGEKLGEYIGVSVEEREQRLYPDRIAIYTNNLQRDTRDRDEFVEQLRITLLHEIGHHLGLDEDAVEGLGLA